MSQKTKLIPSQSARGEREKRTDGHDASWPDWYADYITREQAGKELPE